MPLVRKATAGGGLQLEPGMYTVWCMNVRPDQLESTYEGSTGEIIRFDLECRDRLDEEGNPVQLDAIASDKLTPKSKLTRWLDALGLKVATGEEVDIEQVVGQQCQARVVAKLDNTGKETGFTKVDDLLPLPNSHRRNGPMTLSDWWGAMREKGHDASNAKAKAVEMYGKEPKDLLVEERAEVLASA